MAKNAVKSAYLPHMALLGANLMYGGGFSAAKYIMPSLISPNAFILVRIGVTCLLFWLMDLFQAKNTSQACNLTKQDHYRLLFCGFMGVMINQLLFLTGLSLTSPIHGSIIMLTTPMAVVILSAVFFKDKFKLGNYLGLVLAALGGLIIIQERSSGPVTSNILGDFYIFINAIAYAIYLVMVKPLMTTFRTMLVVKWVFLYGFLMALPFCYQDIIHTQWFQFDYTHFIALSFVVVGCTFFAYLWNAYGLKHLNANISGSYIYLQPVFASLIAIIVLNEQLSFTKCIAGLMVIIGVYLCTKKYVKTPESTILTTD